MERKESGTHFPLFLFSETNISSWVSESTLSNVFSLRCIRSTVFTGILDRYFKRRRLSRKWKNAKGCVTNKCNTVCPLQKEFVLTLSVCLSVRKCECTQECLSMCPFWDVFLCSRRLCHFWNSSPTDFFAIWERHSLTRLTLDLDIAGRLWLEWSWSVLISWQIKIPTTIIYK